MLGSGSSLFHVAISRQNGHVSSPSRTSETGRVYGALVAADHRETVTLEFLPCVGPLTEWQQHSAPANGLELRVLELPGRPDDMSRPHRPAGRCERECSVILDCDGADIDARFHLELEVFQRRLSRYFA